jgi:hypothetical protein
MVTDERFRELALSFEEAVEAPHFHRASFRIRKRIFATLDPAARLAMVALDPVGQSLFADGGAVFPVPGGWGAKGATYFDLGRVDEQLVGHALVLAYSRVAPKSLADRYKDRLV